MKFVDVIVPLAVEGMYTYFLPASLECEVDAGSLVLVAFAGNKKYTGLVARVHGQKPEGYEVKAVEALAEEQVHFSPLHLKFLLWISEYYMCCPGEVMKAALPVMFRLESYTSVTRTEAEVDYAELTLHEKTVISFLRTGEYVALKDVEKYLKLKNGLSVVKSLLAKGYVCIKETVDEMFREKTEQWVKWAAAFSEEEQGKILDILKRAPAQYKLLCHWIEMGQQEIKRAKLLESSGASPAILKALCERHILRIEERQAGYQERRADTGGICNILSGQQLQTLEAIREGFGNKDCVLLKGVTSSGKTEIYIHLIQEYLGRGCQVLYMLPEIALTIQIVKRLQKVFGDRVGIYHSGMSDQMRAALWRKQCSDKPFELVLGVRSSVFLPYSRLGLIIADEEHDASYKQKEPSPRYNGRDAAIMLGKLYGANVLLGSATPSFESWQNACRGKYGLVELNHRYGGVLMPEIVLADVKEDRRKKQMEGSFSPLLLREMRRVLAENKQVILFQNRRGYASYIQCAECGAIPKCRHCDVSLTYYKQKNVLICRYCGAIVPLQGHCADCGKGHYKERTPGTERIEEEVGKLFPDARIARMDLDVMSSKIRFRAVIDDFECGKTDILIGTQMVTKGLDFENVKLVGVIDGDSMINFPDFRAEERAYCMLMQVSGRSGRKGGQGKVIIQAADVRNRVYEMLTAGDYSTFFDLLAIERKLFIYPPFGRMIQVEVRHPDVITLRHAANQLAYGLREKLGKRVCGPAVPEVSRIAGQHRLILLLKIEMGMSYSTVKKWLKMAISTLRQGKKWGNLKIFCDVDP